MARIEIDPNYNSPTFSRATAPADIFKKEDVQNVAAALSTHDHTAGKGLGIGAAAIPNGSVTLAKLAADSVDSSKILDGSIATADLANQSVTNAKLASDTARANLLVNGGFEIWQRGAGPFTVQNSWGPDRWQVAPQGTDTLSVSRDVTGGDLDIASTVSAACTFTLGTGVGTSNLAQPLGECGHLRSKIVSLSVRVRTTVANAVRVSVYNGSAHTYSGFHSGGGAYETLTTTVTVTAGATLVNIVVWFAASCTAYIDNAMLVVGSVPADYAPLHPADDLARCLRYYELVDDLNVTSALTPATTWQQYIPHKARKPVAPTITKNGTWTATNCGQPTVAAGGLNGFTFSTAVSPAGIFQTAGVGAGQNISIESNP